MLNTRTSLLPFIALFALACGGNEHPTNAAEPTTPPDSLFAALDGNWMPQDYCDCLRQKRSAYACKDLVNDVFMMSLVRKGDSLHWSYVSTHEGGPETMLAFDPGTLAFAQPIESNEDPGAKNVQVMSIDHDHLLLQMNNDKVGQPFQRVTDFDTELRKALFSGQFSMKKDSTVIFHDNGEVEGLPGLSRYEVLTDFTEGFDTLDIVFMHNGERDWSNDGYHYVFTDSTLRLYPMLPMAEELVFKIGPLKYELKR